MREILTVWKKELVDNFRDRRTLMTAILMPVLLMPILLIGIFKLQEYQVQQAQEKKALVAIEGGESAPTLVSFLEQSGTVEIKTSTDYGEDIDSGAINVHLSVPENFEPLIAEQRPAEITVRAKSSNLDSQTAVEKVKSLLTGFNQSVGVERLSAAGIDPGILQSVILRVEDIATAEERGGFFIGLLLPMFVVIFAIVGGMYIAIDVSAGEKERKTLEALLFTPISRFKLVMGKYLAVTTMACLTIVLSLVSMTAAFTLYPPQIGSEAQVAINLSAGAVGIMLGTGIILAVMFSGLLLSVAIFAKSYKEAQNYISPFYILAVLPVGLANSLPGFKPTLVFYAIPGMNAVFIIKEALLGQYELSHIAVTALSLVIFAGVGIIAASKIYAREGILFRD